MNDGEGVEIVYIVGRGHSGSTILDILLNNAKNIESVGELLSGIGRLNSECSCGEKIKDCSFWEEVRSRTVEKLKNGEQEVWDWGVRVTKYFGHIARLPHLLFKSKDGEIEFYEESTQALFEAIAETSGKSTVVDSSKEITRGYFLCKNFPNVKLIHLIRSGEETVASNYWRMREGGYYRILRVNLNTTHFHGLFVFLDSLLWNIGNLLIELVKFISNCEVMEVRYEDLCANPVEEVERIGNFLERDVEQVKEKLREDRQLYIGHNIAGNGIRMKENLKFDPKSRTEDLPSLYRVMFRILSWPLLKYYGYSVFS